MGGLFIVGLSTALLALAYLGRFTRYMADDDCTAAGVTTAGFIGAQLERYRAWTGRFSYSFAVATAARLGMGRDGPERDPDHWKNGCVAGDDGIASVRAE